ncbi:hypothetical protein [Acidithiobacillus caldus]|uniref:Uncharacterized protein n=1 Tax=Acidithiobacillus caldus TaxID=33059 RepID=A0A1E7YQB9_9PROT|nr:hypothetical protein [Acidithiobacillus caldus]OFC35776.1 hypothetical protein BAE28_10015 [Acidithiobacillus caldus]OFC38329.1 hypothetical protein BAE27_02225 [Acidithiobacillus caldus]OFC41546.1 hypothetical protein BAE29_02345 [Acidithiobacillus caldus]
MTDTTNWPLAKIRKSLAENPFTVPCLLFRERLLVTEHGPMSDDNDKELLVLVDGGIQTEYVYGHVLKVKGRKGEDFWVALLVRSGEAIDAPTIPLVFERYYNYMRLRSEFYPMYAQDREDLFASRTNFEDACLALAEMIRRFDPGKRFEKEIGLAEYQAPEGICDLRFTDIYGLCGNMDENGGFPPIPKYVYPETRD